MYSARITREHRTAFIMLLDMSGSMAEHITFRNEETTKAAAVAHIVNKFIEELMLRSRREEGIRDYFDIAVLGYGGEGVYPLLSDDDSFTTASELMQRKVDIRKHNITRTLPSGNKVMTTIEQRCWITPRAYGDTPMWSALLKAEEMISKWSAKPQNRASYPPVLINITDGEASDAGYEELLSCAKRIHGIATEDGNALLFNIHLSQYDEDDKEVRFPCSCRELPQTKYAKLLYDMSSVIPECQTEQISRAIDKTSESFRAMSYNCALEELFEMLTIGSVSISMIA